MNTVSLRSATNDDAAFALHVTEACMRVYAEQTWGSWNGQADFDLAFDKVIQLDRRDIGLMGVELNPPRFAPGSRCACPGLPGSAAWLTMRSRGKRN